MLQQMSAITLSVSNLARSRHFYTNGFGWTPIFESGEILFYQMNGFVLGTWLDGGLEGDMQRKALRRPGAFSLAHNVGAKEDVQHVLDQLAASGGRILRNGDAPPHGGFRGYGADPDDHAWEIAWNPAWVVDARGLVTFGF